MATGPSPRTIIGQRRHQLSQIVPSLRCRVGKRLDLPVYWPWHAFCTIGPAALAARPQGYPHRKLHGSRDFAPLPYEMHIMKMITAVVRPFKLDELRQAIAQLGVQGVTVTEVYEAQLP